MTLLGASEEDHHQVTTAGSAASPEEKERLSPQSPSLSHTSLAPPNTFHCSTCQAATISDVTDSSFKGYKVVGETTKCYSAQDCNQENGSISEVKHISNKIEPALIQVLHIEVSLLVKYEKVKYIKRKKILREFA